MVVRYTMKFLLFVLIPLAEISQSSMQDDIVLSGRCANLPESPDARIAAPMMLAPGPPPLLSFRTYEGKLHQRFANSDLMLDDAGH